MNGHAQDRPDGMTALAVLGPVSAWPVSHLVVAGVDGLADPVMWVR
ncbi:hypothetical protein GCM10022284_17160 [Streptomyces hundungensis]